MSVTDDLKETLTLILAGGQGERLSPLTQDRAKPAVPFGGAYRIIDFTLTNCIHSGLRRVYVLTQYRGRSLDEHIRFGWNFLPRRLEQFISVRPPHHHQGSEKWYQGTADAIFQNLDSLERERVKHVLILSGDHIYKMDYGRMLQQHIETGAALTIGAVEVPAADSRRFGIFECDTTNRILSFQEKPEKGPELAQRPGYCYGSMGIYLFETGELVRRLREDAELGSASSHDFGKDVIPRMIHDVPVFAHDFVDATTGARDPYWRDVGTIDAYYEANLDLCSVEPQFNLYDSSWATFTLWHNDPPAKTVFNEDGGRKAEVVDSLLCPGVVVSGAKVHRSILSNRVLAGENAEITDSILFSGVTVGAGARLKRVIVDKWTEIPPGTEIGFDREADERRFKVSDGGVVVVPAGYTFD